MKRNIEKAIEQGHRIIQQNEHFDLCLSEMEELIRSAYREERNEISLFKIVGSAFLAGVAVGTRINKKKGKQTA